MLGRVDQMGSRGDPCGMARLGFATGSDRDIGDGADSREGEQASKEGAAARVGFVGLHGGAPKNGARPHDGDRAQLGT